MHELGVCSDVVAAVQRRAGSRPVARVTVRVGSLHHFHPEAFEQSFALAAAGTVAEGAVPELVVVPARAVCESCGWAGETDEMIASCPGCGLLELRLQGGDDLVLEAIEYRQEQPPGTGSSLESQAN